MPDFSSRAGLRVVWIAAVVGAAAAFGCDEPGGRGGGNQSVATVDGAGETRDAAAAETTVAEVGAETQATPESVGPETVVPETVVPETVDTSLPDTGPSVCSEGCLPISTVGAPTGVVFRQFDDLARPRLEGGAAPSGDWALKLVSIYSQDTFASGISVTFSNQGATAGRIAFEGDALAMALDLDLSVTVVAFGSSGTDSARSLLVLGGCHEVVGARLRGNLASCGEAADPGESTLDFELGLSSLDIGVEIPREALIALLPPEQQEAGDFAIAGPMYLVVTFERP